MAAGVATYSQTSSDLTKSLVKKVLAEANANPLKPNGIVPFVTKSFTIATTQVDNIGDETYFIVCPPNSRLGDFRVTISDVDSNGAPAFAMRLQAQTSGGTETALSADTALVAGGTLAMQESSKFLDFSGQSIGFEVTTASATPASGTAYASGYWIIGTANKGFVYYN